LKLQFNHICEDAIAINSINPLLKQIGFAIPINTAKACLKELLLYDDEARLGITCFTVTEQIADFLSPDFRRAKTLLMAIKLRVVFWLIKS